MKKLILSLLALGIGTAVQAQILDSLRMGAQSVQYEIIEPSIFLKSFCFDLKNHPQFGFWIASIVFGAC